jgi:hypothetical protein
LKEQDEVVCDCGVVCVASLNEEKTLIVGDPGISGRAGAGES